MRERIQQGIGPDEPFIITMSNPDLETIFLRAEEVNPYTRKVTWNPNHLQLVQDLVGDPNNYVVMHHAAFDYEMLRVVGVKVRCHVHDTRVMAHVCDPSLPSYRLKTLCSSILDIDDDDQQVLVEDTRRARRLAKAKAWRLASERLHGKEPVHADYWMADPELVKTYALRDATRAMLLFQFFGDLLREDKKEGGRLGEIYRSEMKLFWVLRRMQKYGTTYLPEKGAELLEFYSRYMAKQKRRIRRMGFADLNCQSPKQMKEIFVEQRGYTTQRRTPTGQPKIDAEQLMAWARGSARGADVDGDGPDGDRLARAILEWKAGKKVLEYLDAYERFRCTRKKDRSAVVHPSYKQTGPITGRLSCSDPNLQQVASAETSRRHSQIRARQRECFGPRPGHLWYLPDYSQIEVWIFAFQAQGEVMCRALLSGHDFHLSTAQAAWGQRDDFEEFKKWWRQRAKMILFSKFYGGGIDKIAELIRCPREDAEQFNGDFENSMPEVPRYMRRLSNKVRREGELINLFGRRYPIDPNLAYRAVNYMIQGSAAEVIKRAMIRLDKLHPRIRLVGTLHDELFLEFPKRLESKQLVTDMRGIMQKDSKIVGLPVPLPVTFKRTESNWSEAEEI
jgi:DNA polymerase-1